MISSLAIGCLRNKESGDGGCAAIFPLQNGGDILPLVTKPNSVTKSEMAFPRILEILDENFDSEHEFDIDIAIAIQKL
jgi:hypothetical protein